MTTQNLESRSFMTPGPGLYGLYINPKKRKEAKRDPPNTDQVKRGPKKPGEARAFPPKPGSQQPDKVTQAIHSATVSSGKSKVKVIRSTQDGEAHRKRKAGRESLKSMIPKGKNGATSPDKKKETNASVSPRGSGSKTMPESLSRKTEASKHLKKPAMPTKVSSYKLTSKKAETEN
ncbi:unnamed protein product [Nyctereutes procyonoides]|uniref:(raccoon dog) hypothetical protein n=1 Tax=Nyctereutes procyonoides TaxID=34880 RepID=A0A811Y981_NYCPR|nr:unnamed protein product [Nyctereutes procyonoides]